MEGSSLDKMIQCLDFILCMTESHWTDFIEGFFLESSILILTMLAWRF